MLKAAAKIGLIVVGTLAVVAIGGGAFIGSGGYNIGADDHHTKLTLALSRRGLKPWTMRPSGMWWLSCANCQT
jgi:hypothetical protein